VSECLVPLSAIIASDTVTFDEMVTSPGKAWTFVAAIYKYRTIFLAVWDAPKKNVFFSLYLNINYL
jgi:hypothetical protein